MSIVGRHDTVNALIPILEGTDSNDCTAASTVLAPTAENGTRRPTWSTFNSFRSRTHAYACHRSRPGGHGGDVHKEAIRLTLFATAFP